MSSESQGRQSKISLKALDGGAAAPSQAGGPNLLARLRSAYEAHPLIAAWIVLAVGMVVILLWASRDVELFFGQRIFLVLATVALAGLCAWIMGWE